MDPNVMMNTNPYYMQYAYNSYQQYVNCFQQQMQQQQSYNMPNTNYVQPVAKQYQKNMNF
jgi:hypothetical protein